MRVKLQGAPYPVEGGAIQPIHAGGTVATLLAVITPSEGAELGRNLGGLATEDRTLNGRDIDHGLLDDAADHRDGGYESDHAGPEASQRDVEARR